MPGRSCTTQLVHAYILNYLTKHINSGFPVEMIFLDFQKASDSVLAALTSCINYCHLVYMVASTLKWIRVFFLIDHNKENPVLYLLATSGIPQESICPFIVFNIC